MIHPGSRRPSAAKSINLSPVVREVEAGQLSILGESPYWCTITNSLFYVDISGRNVFQYDPMDQSTKHMSMPQAVGFAVPTTKTTQTNIILYVGLENCIVEVNFSEKRIMRTVVSVPHDTAVGCRFNDGKCNSEGILYGGYMHTSWREGHRGRLYQLVPPTGYFSLGSFRMALGPDDVHLPNGSAWSADGKLYFIDSGENKIYSFSETKAEDHEGLFDLSDKQIVYTLPEDAISQGHMMDGMTIDASGMLWVVLTNASCVVRIDPLKGTEIMRLPVPSPKPTACTFGTPVNQSIFIGYVLPTKWDRILPNDESSKDAEVFKNKRVTTRREI
jgi:sugar lactone lactonase YvrE